MTWKIQLQWVLLLHIFSLLWTAVVQASIEVRTDNLRRDSRNSSSGIVNANIRGHIERFLKRVVREADDILEVLNSAATTKSSDVFVLGEIEELELLQLSKSQNIQMYIWNKTLFSCIIDDSQNLKILSLDLNAYKTTLIAEIHKVTNCDMTAVSEGKLIITCIGNQLVEGDGNVKTYILEQSVAGSYDLQYIHLIEARGFSHISMWHQQGEIMLMICSMTSPTAFDTSVTGQSNLYRWTGAYFDNIQVFSPANASASHHFVISNQHFIAEAHFANSKGHHNCYSYIYRYSAASKMYIPLQLLPTKGAKHFTSFVLNASGRSNVFLAVANSCQDDHGGKCNPFTTSGIYCYHHDRFVLFQEIPTANAIQWLAIEVENNVLLAVANALTGVKVYQYNGWRFVPAESQFTLGSFGIGVTGLAGVKLEEKIILGGVNGNSLRELPVFFEVKLKRENFFQTYHDDLDKWCSARLRSVGESTYPDARAVTVPLSNSSKYSFNKSISIDGDLIVLQQGNVDKVLLRSTNIVMPGVPVGLSHKINSLKERSKLIADTMKRTIPITGNVTWPAKLHFRSLDSASSKSINVVDDVIGHFLQANGLSINDDNLALLDDGRVISRLNISQVEVKADVKVNTLAGHPFIEYATLSGEHTFKKDVIFVENFDVQEVNAAKIISETAPGHQRYLSVGNVNFKDYFHCSSALATRLECQTLNGINVSKLQEDVIITGEYNFVRGKLEVDGNLTYRGNLQSNVMGSINLETPLKLNSFNRPKISVSHRILTIKMNWLEGQSINGIHVPDQLLVNRSDSSYVLEKANFPKVSAQSIFIESNLDTIKVRNGSLDVMKVSEDQFVTSRKAFRTIRLSSQSLRRNKRAASADNQVSQVRDKSLVSPDNLYKHFGWDESLIKVANFVRREAELSNLVKLLHTASGGNILIPSCYLNYYQVLKKLYYLPSVITNADELLGANCAINSKNSWKLQSIPVSQDDIDSVTYNSKLYKSRLNDRLKEVNFKRNIPVMSKISKVNLIPAVKKHLPLMELLLSALRQILNSSKTSTKVIERDFESIPKAPKINEEKSDILYFLCDTVRQIGHYPAILRRHIGSSSKTAVIESALIDLVVIQFLSSAPEYGDIYYLLRKPPSCHNFEDITYFVGVSKILHEFQDLVNSTNLNTSIRYKRDPENEETFLRHGKESGKVSRSHISSTGHDFVTKVESWNLNYSSVRYSAESVIDGMHEGSLPYSPEAFSSKTSLTNHQQSHFMGFSSFSLDVADFEDSSLVSMIAPINWVDRSSDRVTFALDYVGSGTVSVPMFSSEFSKIAYGPTALMSGVANFEIDILNSETALTVKQPLSGTAAYPLTEHLDYDDYDNASNETAHTGKQLLNKDYDNISSAGAKYHLGLYSNTAITMEQPLSETITYLIISPSAYNDFASNVQTRDCSGSLTTVLEEESTVNGYFSHQKDFLSFNALSPVPLNNVFAISSREHSLFTTVKQIWKTLAFSFPEKVGIEGYSGETYSASNLVTVPVDVSTPFDIHPSSPSIDNLKQSSAKMSEYGSVVAVYSKKEKLEAGCTSCETTVKETWKTPAISSPVKVGMEGYNGEKSDNFIFLYSATNLVTVPVDVSTPIDIHPSSPSIDDLEQSSAKMSEYGSIVAVYSKNEKLEAGCVSCETTVKETWKTPAISSPVKVGMEGYNGEKSDNFIFMYSASNLVTVPVDVSTPIDIHPSSPSIDDLEQSSAEMSEYGSVVAVYSKKEKLEAGCVSCETTVKETWKAPAITYPDNVGMEGYSGEISENFGFTYSASNLVTVPVDVSTPIDIHPSPPSIDDLEQSSAKMSEYGSIVAVYSKKEMLEAGCISCETTVKETWKTPAISSPVKVGMEGYNGEKSDNFIFMYSASNLVTVPVDVSTPIDIHPSSPSIDDLEQSSAKMSEYDSIVAVYSKNEKLEAGCISCETTVKETWKTPAISSPVKVGMEGYNGEKSDNFIFMYSASNLVTVPGDVSTPIDIHPSSSSIDDLEQSSAEMSEYGSVVAVYSKKEKLEAGCVSCETTVKETWKAPAITYPDNVGMEGYSGEISENFGFTYSASNLVTVPVDVSTPIDIHPSPPSIDDLEQSSAKMSEYGSIVAVYSKKEMLEAGCISCETTVKETWKTPAISSPVKVGMEGYNGEKSDNFIFMYSASNLVTVPVDVSTPIDIHPSSPSIDDLEQSSAEMSEYGSVVAVYSKNEKLEAGCVSCETTVKETWKAPAITYPDNVGMEGYSGEISENFGFTYSASNLVTVPVDVSTPIDIHPSSPSIDDLEQSSAKMSEYGSIVAVYSKKEMLEAGCISCETTVKETWKTPAISSPVKVGMEGYNGEKSDNFIFMYSASNLVTVPVDVSTPIDIHPSSSSIDDLEQSSAEMSEYGSVVAVYSKKEKLEAGCVSCETTVKETWKAPAITYPDNVGMEGYSGEISENFGFTYSESNLVTVPVDVSTPIDIHPSLPSIDDLEQTSAKMSEYGSIVAVYSKNEKLEAGCISCETTVKETWKAPAITYPDKVGMEGYNEEKSGDNFVYMYSASNLVTVLVDVSPSFDIHPSTPGIEDLEESSAETSEYDPSVQSYRENEKLIDGCISCDTTVKEIPWKTPAFSSLDKVGLEGYNGEKSDDNFGFMYSASNLVTVPLDGSTSFDIHPSSPSIDDLEQSSAKMSKSTLIIDDLRENGKLLDGCISCDASRSLDVSSDTVKAIDISSRESILEHSVADSIFAIHYTDVLTNYAVGEVTKTLPISEEGRGFIPQRIHSFNEPFSVSLSEETLDLAKPSNRYDSVPSPMYVLPISGIDRNLQDFHAVTTAVKNNYPVEVTMLSSQLLLAQESKVPVGNVRERYLNVYLNRYKTAMNSYDSEISILPIYDVYPSRTTLTELFPSSTLDIIPSLSDKVSPEYSSFLNWQQHILNSKEFSDDYMEQGSLVSSLFNRRMTAKGIVKYGTNNSWKLTESLPISSSASKYDTDDASGFTTVWRSSIVIVDIASELSSSSVKNYPSETVTHKQTVGVIGKYESNYKAKSLHSETKNKSILLKGRQGDSGMWKENVFVLKTVKDLSANNVNRSINTTSASSFESTLRPGETPSASVIVMHSMLPPAHSHFHVSVPSEVSSKCHSAMNTYMTQHRTYIKCISCTFIFKSYFGIVPSTLLVQNFPVTKTQDQHVDDLNEPLEFEEVDFNQFQITTFASDRVTDVQYSVIDSFVPSVTHQDTISKFTHISMVNVATAYDGYNYHDFSEDTNERNIDAQHSTPPASTTYVESESATYTTDINAVKVGRAYHGDVHHELSEDMTTTDDGTTKQPEYFVSDVHLENIVNYINEFRRFASNNFSQSSQYSEVVGKNIEVILNCSYNYFWTLRHKFSSMISNYSYFDDCKKRLEFVQKLSGHYAFSPNDVVLLTTLRDAPWLNELISILDIKLRKSRGQPVTIEEEVKFRNIAETDDKTLFSPPPMVTIVKEAIYGKINKISNLREMISQFMKRQNKGHISRLIREAVSVPYDILHLSDELGKYSKEDPLYIVTHREAFLKLVEDYFKFKTYYFSHSGIHSDEIDKLLKKNDILLEIFEHDLAHLENNEKSKLNDISDRLHNNTVHFPSLKRRYFSLSLDEPTSQEKMLLEYYCNLDEMLYTFIFEAINESNLSEDLHAIVNEMQENMDVLADYIQSFYKNQHDLPLRSEEKLGIRINWNKSSNVNEKVLTQWQGLSGDIASICKCVMTLNGLQKADCSGISKQVLGNAFSLDALNVSRVLVKYLKSINFLLRDINEIDIVNEDAGLHVNLTDCLLNVLTTTKSIFSDFHLSHKHINSDTLWNQESCLNATIGFSKKPASTFVTSQFFQNLDYLKPLILYTFVETKHAIECLQALDLEYENRLNQPPVILHVPLNAQNSSYENTTIFEQTVDHSASHSARSSFLCDRDVGHLEYLLNLTRKIIRMNPMNKTKVLSKSKPPDSIAVSSTASDVLLTLNSIINYLQQCTSRVSLDDIDELLKNHQLLMKDIEGHISPLSDEAKLKVLMIYGESLGGRAAAAENLILRDIEKGNLTAESEGEFEVFGFFVHGRVAKYDLKELSVLPSPLSPASATSLKYINENMNKLSRVIIQGGLFVSTMNEVNVEHLTQHAVPVSRISVYGNIHFKQKVAVVSDMNVQRINGLVAENFVLCKGNPEFSLPVAFMKDIHVDGNVALTDLINDMDISSFSKRIVLTNSRHIVIEKDVIFTSLKAERVNSRKIKISGVPLEKVVKKGEVSVLTGNKTFLSLQVADSTRFSALDVQYINDLSIPVMFRDSLWKNSDEQQMITYVGHLKTCHVNNSLTTRGISYLSVHNNYSTVHLPRFFKNVIYSDKEVVVSRVIIRGNANVLSLIFFNTLDGTASDTFSNGWLLKTADQTVSGKIYAADVSSYSVAVRERGTIFDVDIELLNRAVKVNESITFIRDINVARLLSNRSISVEGLVQSMNISVESISKLDEVVIITAPKLFLVSTFAKTLSLSGLINSIHLGKHCHTSSSRNISIIGNVHLIQNTLSQSLKFDSNFINENFLEVYWHKDRNVEIRYKMTFKHVSVVEINATVNNVDLRGLDSKVLHRTCNDWNRLQGQSYIKNLITKALLTKSVLGSTLNGIAIESFSNLLQKIGNQVFTGNVTLNRISVEGNVSIGPRSLSNISRLCRYQEICVISAVKYFDSYVTVKGNIVVNDDKTLQGVDISDIFVNVLSDLGHVFGTTEFKGNVRLSALGVNGHVDSITVTKETLLLRAGSQVMSGLVTVNSSLARAVTTPEIKTDEWSVGLMDVSELSAKAVHQEINNILHSPVFFENEVKFNFGDMELEHMTAGLQSVDPEIVFGALKNLSFLNQKTVRGQVLELKGWQQVQVFEEPIERIMPVDLTVQSSFVRFTPKEEYLALVSSVGNTRILTRNFTQQHFNDPGINLEGGCAQKVIGYTTEYSYNLLTSHSCPINYQPEDDRMRVWEFNPQDTPFVKLSQNILVTGIMDMDVVALDDKVCVLIAGNEKDRVSLYCQGTEQFVSVNSIEEGAQKLSALHPSGGIGNNITLFAVASQGKYPQERGYFAVLSYDFIDGKFSRIQKIELEIVVWVDMIFHQNKVFIAVVSQSRSGNHLGQVNVYRIDLDPGRPSTLSRRVHIHQQVLVKNPFEAHFSKLDSKLSLFIIDQNGYISWYSQKGIQRFSEVGKLHMAGKQQLEVWLSHVNESYSHWVAVSGEDCNYKESVYNRKDTQIIQSVLRGRQFLP